MKGVLPRTFTLEIHMLFELFLIKNVCLKLFKIFETKAVTVAAPRYASVGGSVGELRN